MNKSLFTLASIIMAFAILLGAFGAHGLSSKLNLQQINSFETAVRYQIIHALALLIISVVYNQLPSVITRWITYLMITGIIFFSGSIYFITTGHLMHQSYAAVVWWVTPLGGLLLIVSWLLLAFSVIKSKSSLR
jgi:uncharacterized membrane protein YgdD (TMEM256/DUF423 family)